MDMQGVLFTFTATTDTHKVSEEHVFPRNLARALLCRHQGRDGYASLRRPAPGSQEERTASLRKRMLPPHKEESEAKRCRQLEDMVIDEFPSQPPSTPPPSPVGFPSVSCVSFGEASWECEPSDRGNVSEERFTILKTALRILHAEPSARAKCERSGIAVPREITPDSSAEFLRTLLEVIKQPETEALRVAVAGAIILGSGLPMEAIQEIGSKLFRDPKTVNILSKVGIFMPTPGASPFECAQKLAEVAVKYYALFDELRIAEPSSEEYRFKELFEVIMSSSACCFLKEIFEKIL